MIKAFHILLKSGEPLFHRVYGKEQVDESLFSGFLGAVYNFARELGHGDIKTVEVGDARFVCEVSENLIFVAVVGKDDDEQELKNFLGFASKAFVNRFKEELKTWHGNVTVFRPFTQELDHLVEDYQMKRLPGKVKLVPFLRDASGGPSSYPFNVEIASVFSLLEDVRERGGGFLWKKPEEELRGIVRVLWPFWIVPFEDGDRGVIVDAMSTAALQIRAKRYPALDNADNFLKINSVDVFVNSLEDLLLDLESEKLEEFPLYGFLVPELVKDLEISFSQARLGETKDYVVFRPLVTRTQAVENKTVFMKLIQDLEMRSQRLMERENFLTLITEKWLKVISEKIVETGESYKVKIEETVKDVEKQIGMLLQLREEELKKLDAWFAEADKNLILEIKELFGPLIEVLEDVALKSTEEIEKSIDEKISVLEVIEGRIQKLANVSEYMNKTKKLVENISKSIKKIDSTIEKISKKIEIDKNAILKDFDGKIMEQRSRVDLLKEEAKDVLSKQQILMGRVKSKIQELSQLFQRERKEIGHLLNLLNSLIVKMPDKIFSPSLFYIPLYIGKFEDTKQERFFVVPPLVLLKSNETISCDFGQKTLPLDLPNPAFLEAVKGRAETLINDSKELKLEIQKGLKKANLINSQQIETSIYEGLNNLLSLNILTEKDFQILKARAKEVFRTEERI
ncbi:MAG: hypothetical protein QXG44_08655 [Candidatus Jordarchaeaceae archaeon]